MSLSVCVTRLNSKLENSEFLFNSLERVATFLCLSSLKAANWVRLVKSV